MIDDPAPGFQLIYDERWGSSLTPSLVLLGGGLVVATLLVLIAQNVRLYTNEITLRTLGERYTRYMLWGFASVFLSIAVWGAIAGPVCSARRGAALAEGRCEWSEGTVNMVDIGRGGPFLLVGKRWLHQSPVWQVRDIPVGTRVRWCEPDDDEEPLRVEIRLPRKPSPALEPSHSP